MVKKWKSRGLNPGPCACEAHVIPLHHTPRTDNLSSLLTLNLVPTLGQCTVSLKFWEIWLPFSSSIKRLSVRVSLNYSLNIKIIG